MNHSHCGKLDVPYMRETGCPLTDASPRTYGGTSGLSCTKQCTGRPRISALSTSDLDIGLQRPDEWRPVTHYQEQNDRARANPLFISARFR
jgi:hypothetical protein